MVGREIEGCEVVIVVFNVRPIGDPEPHSGKDALKVFDRLGDRMAGTNGPGPARQGEIDPDLG